MHHYSTNVKRLFTYRVLTYEWNFTNASCSYIEVSLHIIVIITLLLCSYCCCYLFVEIVHLRNSVSKLAVRITQIAIKRKILYKTTKSNNGSSLKNIKTNISDIFKYTQLGIYTKLHSEQTLHLGCDSTSSIIQVFIHKKFPFYCSFNTKFKSSSFYKTTVTKFLLKYYMRTN
jgi:hypothetical protein